MISTTRKTFDIGGSTGITLPQGISIGESVSITGSDKLLLINTTGEYNAAKLGEFFLEYIEPKFEGWWEKYGTMKKLYIPESLWDRFYKVSGEMRGNNTYAKAQQDALYNAISKYCEEGEKFLDEHK